VSVAVRNEQPVRAEAHRAAYTKPRANILVTYSGPQGAQSVVDDLRRAGLPAFAEVLFAVPCAMIPIPSSLRRPGLFPASWYMRTAALPGIGLVGDEAVAVAESWGADLVVVGSQGSPSVEPPYFACMSPSVAARAHCTVRIARRRALGGGTTPRLLVGIDGSPEADEAALELARRRWPSSTAVRLVNVHERSDDPARDGLERHTNAFPASSEPEPRNIRLALSRAASAICAAGLEVSTELRQGKPIDELIAAADDWHANCIVAGAYGHGLGGRTGGLRTGLGAVSAALVERAPLSIEVVRARPVLAARAAIR
jgi:nucleotide-binding universal stress UspA family protein